MDAHFDQVVDGRVLEAVVANFFDEVGVDPVDAHGDELIRRNFRVAGVFHAPDKFGANSVDAERNQVVRRNVLFDELLDLLLSVERVAVRS